MGLLLSKRTDPTPLANTATMDVRFKVAYMKDDAEVRKTSLPGDVREAFNAFLASSRFTGKMRQWLSSHGSAYFSSVTHWYACTKVVVLRPGVMRATFKKRAAPPKIKNAVRDGDGSSATVGDLQESVVATLKVFGRAADPLLTKRRGQSEYWFAFDDVTVSSSSVSRR